MTQAFERFIDDAFGGHVVYSDRVEPTNPEVYLENIRHSAQQQLEQDIWASLYVDGHTHPTLIRWSAYHYEIGRASCRERVFRAV